MASFSLLASPSFLLTPSCKSFTKKPICPLRVVFCKTHKIYSKPISSKLENGECLPPITREEAILQARISLAAMFRKIPMDSSNPKRRRNHRPLRLQVEIPLFNNSDTALASLVADLLTGFSLGKKASPISFAICSNSPTFIDAIRNRISSETHSAHISFMDFDEQPSQHAQVILVPSPSISSVAHLQKLAQNSVCIPLVLLNPSWILDELEVNETREFLRSFEVVYSFTPLEIRSFFNKIEGAVLKYIKSGPPAGTPWLIFAKEGAQMRCISSLMSRPSTSELENLLYNFVAANSLIAKSAKSLREFITARKSGN